MTTLCLPYTPRRRVATPLHVGIVFAIILLALAGCATKPGIIFAPPATAIQWPGPPDPPRIFYVGQLATSKDLKPGVNGMEAVGQALFGKKESHSMLTPMAVCTDGADRVFVADSNAQLVHVFDLQTRKYAMWKPGKDLPQFAQPVGITWDPINHHLLVADSVAGSIFLFDTKGTFLGELGQGILQRPVGMAVDPSPENPGRIFVADVGAHQILIFGADGRLIKRLGSRGTALGSFNYPTNVALDLQGHLYVSDSLNFRIQQFDRDLKPLRQFGKKGDMPGCFAQPKGLATDSEGHIYVLDGQFENVQIFAPDGNILMDFGEEGNGPGQFWLPTGICIDGRDRLWIADSYNRRIQVFDYRKLAATTEVKP
jgi:sugar lactone lactonase YvrE